MYVSLPAAFLLIGASLAVEGTGPLLLANGPAGVLGALKPVAFDLSCAAGLSFLVNLTSFWAIGSTGSLTFKVAGCLKNLVVIWYSVAVGHEHVERLQIAGYLVSVAGFLLYTVVKSKPAVRVDGEKAKTS